MYLGKADVNTYDKGVEREFLVSNGAGSYGFSTVIGANTRSEHGLLVVRRHNSAQHAVLVSKLEETLYAHNKKYQLSTNRYKDLIFPDGYRYLQEYQGSPYPSMMFVIHSIFLKKSIFMPQNGTSTIVKYELLASPDPISMDIRPLFAHRPKDEVPAECDRPTFDSTFAPEGIVNVKGRDLMSHISFALRGEKVKWATKPLWFENLIYEKDGLPDKPTLDFLWSPGFGTVSMKQGDAFYVVLSEEPLVYSVEDIEALERETEERMDSFAKHVSIKAQHSVIQDMVHASCHLIADHKGAAPAVFSGFPSVELRARDTFVSLPGLTLATGRRDTARGVLDSWLERANARGGLMPAVIAPQGESRYGDIDAGLWFLYAAEKYAAAEGIGYATERFDSLRAILDKYFEGCEDLGAVMDDGTKLLKYFNHENTRHWMSGDAGGEPLVERRGYLVEINALWYNALLFMASVAKEVGDSPAAERYEKLADGARASFESIFWNEDGKYLFDWVDPVTGEKNATIRPNAIFALSLPHALLPDDKGRAVFTTCWNELYTTYGLRTLDPHHHKFKGRAEGRPDQRQKARLRGMAWPWLLGHFITAFMRYNPDAKEMGWSLIRPFSSHLRRGCLGGVAEYFDGTMPYRPNGDVLSAMSLGDLLRVMYEDLM